MLKPELQQLDPIIKETSIDLLKLLKIEGMPANELVTEGQLNIFAIIVFRWERLVEILCTTQYGKSIITALACLIVSCIQNEMIAVIAPTNEKAKIIMRYYIEHLGDHEIFYSQLEKNTKLERLRQEESKERIVLRNGGGIYVLSCQQKNVSKSIEAAMGAGAKIVIIDEACLIQDDTEATIFRMIAGKTIKGKSDTFYCKIGNPFYAMMPYSHFKTSWDNPSTYKIFIDYKQALKEGRYTQEFINEAWKKPLFNVLYGCEFPNEDEIDNNGYRKLILSEKIQYIEDKNLFDKSEGIPILGGDISGGGDENVFIIRKGKYAFVAGKNKSIDTMTQVNEIERLHNDFKIDYENCNIDDIGIGRGVRDRCKELKMKVNGVGFGESADDKETYLNIRAEVYWRTKIWIENGGLLEKNENFQQLSWMRYKQASGDKKLQLEPKDEIRRRHKRSPDYADAFALTFYENKNKSGFIERIKQIKEEEKENSEKKNNKKGYSLEQFYKMYNEQK